MSHRRRIRLSERDAMEGGIRCPNCGSYTSFVDILATERCRGVLSGECELRLSLDLVVEHDTEPIDVDADG
ncbi:hypothetical protein [Salinigranum sp. GCM10025319]|uniref:hypothetical protein n=1 Tax=Salinigranum sp. GCM10025319 TaxID=3252687 RepID=UPI00361F488B